MQQSAREYKQWLTEVYDPYLRKQKQHTQTLRKVGLLGESQEQREEINEDTVLAKLIDQLAATYSFASKECDASNALRQNLLGKQAASRFGAQLSSVRQFLAQYNRAKKYNLPIDTVNTTTFEDPRSASTFCARLRKGLQQEIFAALRSRLETFLASVPIGGREKRSYDVRPLLRFAIERRLETLAPQQIYEEFVASKMRDAASEMQSVTMQEEGEYRVEPSVEELEQEFELLATRSSDKNRPSLTESAFRLPLGERRVLTEGNRLCTSACRTNKTLGRKVCQTKPYRSYGFVYDWDYC